MGQSAWVELIEEIRQRQPPNGAWSFLRCRQPATEPSCLAALALLAQDGEAVNRVAAFLKNGQLASGA